MTGRLPGIILSILLASSGHAEVYRIATFNTELSHEGPGLMLKAIQGGSSPAVEAVLQTIAQTDADILILQGIDWDHELRGLGALRDRLDLKGSPYPYSYSPQPNSGLMTGFDLDGDNRLGGPGDAQGYGQFTGQGGMAILSRFPFDHDAAMNFSALLWRDFPDALLPARPDGSPFPSEEALAVQRLSSVGHWLVPVVLPDGKILYLIAFQAAPPVFDGPEDRNGRRNHDELRLVGQILIGQLEAHPDAPVVVAGGSNLDPYDSDGRSEAIRDLLSDARLQDPEPRSPGAAAMPSQGHHGSDALDTVDWPGVGRLRVDYVLPAAGLNVVDAGVFWPADGDGAELVMKASRHRLVWVDIRVD